MVIDYNATLLPDNLVRNPDVDAAQTNNSSRPTFWHYSSHASWSDDEALSPTHSLELVDTSTTAYEEWRSYATDVPAGEDRSFKVRWFWKYDVAEGEEFRARLRLSNDGVTSLDLTNPLQELNFTVTGTATDFEMFETTIDLPDGVRSFDLTFISGGALSALGSIYIDDISAAILKAPVLLGDYNGNGIVDAADYIVWRNSLGASGSGLAADGDGDNMVTQLDYDIWKANFGTTAGGAGGAAASVHPSPAPEPSAMLLFLVGTCVAAIASRRRRYGSKHRNMKSYPLRSSTAGLRCRSGNDC